MHCTLCSTRDTLCFARRYRVERETASRETAAGATALALDGAQRVALLDAWYQFLREALSSITLSYTSYTLNCTLHSSFPTERSTHRASLLIRSISCLPAS